jgi:hypothetical protein
MKLPAKIALTALVSGTELILYSLLHTEPWVDYTNVGFLYSSIVNYLG